MKTLKRLTLTFRLFLIWISFQTDVYSQTSYVHVLTGIGANEILATYDGGYALSDFDPTVSFYGSFGLIKVNAAGMIEYHNYYTTYCELHPDSRFLIGEAPDSTLFFTASPEDCMTGYTSWYIVRLGHSGNVSSVSGDSKFFQDYDIRELYNLEPIRNTSNYSVVGYFYNEDFNYNQVAGLYYLNVYDQSGSQLWSVAIDDFNYPYTKLRGSQAFYDSNGMLSDFLANGITGTNTFLMKTNSSGNVLWQKQYQPAGYPIIGMAQVDSTYFLLESSVSGSAIHKIDMNGNSITRVEIPNMNFSKINVFDNSKLILTGSNNNANPVILELDTNMIFSSASIIPNASLISFDIDETKEAILNVYTYPGNSSLYVEKRFSGSACNYIDTLISIVPSASVIDLATQFPTTTFSTVGVANFSLYPLTGSVSVSCSQTSGISDSENEETSVIIYPNPTSESVTIHFSNLLAGKVTVKVSEVTGKLLYSTNTLKEDINFETCKLKGGVYLVNITGADWQSVQKLVIQR